MELVSLPEACRIVDRSDTTLRRWIKEGRLVGHLQKRGRRTLVFIERDRLERFMPKKEGESIDDRVAELEAQVKKLEAHVSSLKETLETATGACWHREVEESIMADELGTGRVKIAICLACGFMLRRSPMPADSRTWRDDAIEKGA